MAKGPRVQITLECTEARKEGKSPSRYTTTKNKKTHPERLETKKYNPFLRRHTVHKEIKQFQPSGSILVKSKKKRLELSANIKPTGKWAFVGFGSILVNSIWLWF